MTNIYRIKIMPVSIEENLGTLATNVEEKVVGMGGKFHGSETQDIAFGLKALIVTVILLDEKGSDEIEEAISSISGVNSVQTIDMRRAVG